jgi:hypothetical protein
MQNVVDECLRLKAQLDDYVVKEFQKVVNKFCDDFDASFWAGNGAYAFEHNPSKIDLQEEFFEPSSSQQPNNYRLLYDYELGDKHAESDMDIPFTKYKKMFWAYANIIKAEEQVQSLDDRYGVLTWLAHYKPKKKGK